MEKLVILGAGESGIGAALLAESKGYEVFVSDMNTIKSVFKEELESNNIDFEEEGHNENLILDAGVVVKSPGIPDNVPVLKKCKERGIAVISEIEFAYGFCEGKIVCITGSNGKTTTTELIYSIFKEAGLNAAMVGNIGNSFARQIFESPKDYYIIEASSFQLDNINYFKPDVSVLLNITPDHLDRYDYSFNNYAESKFRIIMNQTEKDYFIFCKDDEEIVKRLDSHNNRVIKLPFSVRDTENEGAFIRDSKIVVKTENNEFAMLIDDLALQGKHNTYNSMAASVAARVLDIRDDYIRRSLSAFKGVEHRLEKYLQIRDVQFINDSKATNINSTWYALDSLKSDVIWIAGGVDKGNDYSALDELVKSKVKGIVCLGLNNEKIVSHFGAYMENIIEVDNMADAVKYSYRMADKGDAVLLSPTCASFDLFESYEDRGNQFKIYVREL